MTTQPHKHCFFCGEANPMSAEHAWPQWLGKGAQVDPTQTTRTLGYGRTGDDEMTEVPNMVVKKNGSVLKARIREVCRTCNSGWMSRLETSAKPLLERLWSPSYALGRTTITVDEAAILATWATKTAWVRERLASPVVTASAEMRRYLMDNQLPPEFARVWIARHDGRTNFGVHVARLQATHEAGSWDDGQRRHILVCTLTFRGLSVVVRTDDGWGAPSMRPPADRWRPIWPITETLQWPPPRAANDDDVQAVGLRYDWLRHPDVSVFKRDPNGIQTITRN